MIYKLNKANYELVIPLLKNLEINPVMFGVIDGNNLGDIFVNNLESPTSALIWAKNEMFYLVGDAANEEFNDSLESFFIKNIVPEALEIGDLDLNLEAYPYQEWEPAFQKIFRIPLNVGERVPFVFHKEQFSERNIKLPTDYQLLKISKSIFEDGFDSENIIQNEIMKFWESLEKFFELGIGYSVIHSGQVVGTCLSVFVSKNHYEIGINTFSKEHRGQGLATTMATAFIRECLEKGGIPHWTTESFRLDSIVIANKLGFEQKANYKVHYQSFNKILASDKAGAI